MIIISLLIAHLLADFFLQPTTLIKWKLRSNKGVFFHVIIFALISLLFLFQYLGFYQTWITVLLITLAHFFIDKLKILFEKKQKVFPLSFLLDQFLHLLTLIIGGIYLSSSIPQVTSFWLNTEIISNFNVGMLLFVLVYLSYVLDIIFIQDKNIYKHISMKNDLKFLYTKTATKIGLFSIIYLVFLLVAVIFY